MTEEKLKSPHWCFPGTTCCKRAIAKGASEGRREVQARRPEEARAGEGSEVTAKKLKEVEREFSNKERADAERVWMEEAWARWAKLPLFERWTAMYDAAVSISDELLRETKASSAKAAASKPGV